MTRASARNLPPLPVNVSAPGNAHLILCECGHPPEDHDAQAGCIAMVQVQDQWTGGTQSLGEDFCPCQKYEVAP